MRRSSFVSLFVGAVFVSLFLFFLKSPVCLAVPLGSISQKSAAFDLEEHVIKWATEQVCALQCAVDSLEDCVAITDSERDILLSGISGEVSNFIDLLEPIKHTDAHMMRWMKEFTAKHPEL